MEADFDMGKLLAVVLEESGYAESRASKMDVDDFLRSVPSPSRSFEIVLMRFESRLLTVFHKHGLHFA